jgi:hypothetical protein
MGVLYRNAIFLFILIIHDTKKIKGVHEWLDIGPWRKPILWSGSVMFFF